MVVQKLGIPVGQHQPDVDVGISGKKSGDDRPDMQASKDDGRGNDEIALRRDVFTGGFAFGLARLLQDAPTGRDILLARRREVEAAR